MSRGAPQRRGAARETALRLTARRQFAGVRKAQDTARRGGASVYGCCKPGFTHQTVALARNRASGFGGAWQVR
ncbi:hypothetical protein RBV54_005057, partial [Salmonella enterica]|nr:hypothetical protein [Salmonella enterica]ELF7042900.1 hypothetical protein [Salmonella enterica]